MDKHKHERSTFSGKIGFVLSAAGASVGLGNIWMEERVILWSNIIMKEVRFPGNWDLYCRLPEHRLA